MAKHAKEFAGHVYLCRTIKQSERVVRIMLEEVAKDCPLTILEKLGWCLVTAIREEEANAVDG